METIEKSIEVLNDLIQINNDRIAGFARAVKDLGDNNLDLKAFFQSLREESRMNVQELSMIVSKIGGEAETETSSAGALHRVWIDVKATFSGHDRKSVLEECERGEDAIKNAYESALTTDHGFSADVIEVLSRQQQGIIDAHNKIKTLRDSQDFHVNEEGF